ncbi:MAG: CopG family transcriptional regulator [Betaproteobacteria bacterium]|nr:CopG family transcriptional regulator [Betaproteobacteria bacterium]
MLIRKSVVLAALIVASLTGNAAELKTVQVFKSPTCGCCGQYVEYLKKNGLEVSVVNTLDTRFVHAKYGVSNKLQSCHTALINGYVVEGHVPIGAIRKLVSEDRKIKGISLPGMPAGSPGMGPVKPGTLTVYEIPDGDEKPKVFSVE